MIDDLASYSLRAGSCLPMIALESRVLAAPSPAAPPLARCCFCRAYFNFSTSSGSVPWWQLPAVKDHLEQWDL